MEAATTFFFNFIYASFSQVAFQGENVIHQKLFFAHLRLVMNYENFCPGMNNKLKIVIISKECILK